MMRRAVGLTLTLALLLGISGCDVRTTLAGEGMMRLHATFDDADNLVPGHNVRMGDVVVGSIREVALDEDYRADVTFTVDREIPADTLGTVRQMSLLGEHFLDLSLPEDGAGPMLAEGDRLPDTAVATDLEDVAEDGIVMLDALITEDMAALVDTAAGTFGDRGEQLGDLIGQVADVSSAYAEQTEQLGRVIDSGSQFGADLAVGADEVGALVDEVSAAVATMNRQRDRMIDSTEGLTELATRVREDLLVPHADAFEDTMARLRPLLAAFADQEEAIGRLIDGALVFVVNMDRLVVDGKLQGFARLGDMLPNPATMDPGPIDQLVTPLPDVPDIDDRAWIDELLEQLR